jgi:hypothetical protein
VVVVTGGLIVLKFALPLTGLSAVIAIGLVTLGLLTALAVFRTPWAR